MIVLTALSASIALLSPSPQAGRTGEIIYQPARSVADQGIVLKGWGSGLVGEEDGVAYEGVYSIRVSTRNLFQGGVVQFTKPEKLGALFSDKASLLRLQIKTDVGGVQGGSPAGGMGGIGGGPAGMGGGGRPGGGIGGGGGRPGGGMPGGIPGGMPGGGGRPGGGFGAGNFPGQGGGGGRPSGGGGLGGAGGTGGEAGGMGGGQANGGPRGLSTIRLIVTTSDGLKSEAYLPYTALGANPQGWKAVSIPLQAISGFDRTNKEVTSIAFSGDATSTFYVGDMRVVNDATPLRIEASRTPNIASVALGDEVTFTARASGGSSVVDVTWDFDATDGVGVDSEGATTTYRFRKAGDFTITATARDRYGLKEPYSTTLKIKVNG